MTFRSLKIIAVAIVGSLGLAAAAAPAEAATIDVLVLQEDWDQATLERDTQIQRGLLIEFQKVLNAPSMQRFMQPYGLTGVNVYDEVALGLGWYNTTRTRRSDEELIQLSRQIPGYSIDAVILYSVRADAVRDPFTNVALLRGSMFYRVLDVKSGRFLGGDTVQLNDAGIPMVGCAAGAGGQPANESCVKDFVLANIAPMARNAANKIAIQLAALSGGGAVTPTPVTPTPVTASPTTTTVTVQTPQPVAVQPGCAGLPVTYQVEFQGLDSMKQNAVEEFMASWSCAMGLELEDASLTEITYRYQTRADRMRIVRNIRQMGEMMGLIVEPRLDGESKIVVETLALRAN